MNKKKRKQKRLAKKINKKQSRGLLSYLDSTYELVSEYHRQIDTKFAKLEKQVNNLSKEVGELKKGE